MRFFTLFILIFTFSAYASIGHISALRGDVFIERDGKESKAFKGFKLEKKDVIKTSKRSKAQFIFKDRTVIRVGRNSVFEISDYLYDKTKRSKAKFKVRKGFFSAVTGRIGKLSKDRFKLRTKTSTIGIRGTHFQGLITENSEDIACLKGSIFVEVAGESIDVMAGEILNIKAGIPSTPKVLKAVNLEEMEKESVDEQLSPEMASLKYEAMLSELLTKTELLKSSDEKVVMSIYSWDNPESDSYSDIQKAKPFDISIEANRENIDSNYFSSNSWDGDSEGGKILKYSGEIIIVGDLSADGTNILTENGKQEINILLDTTNSFMTGDFSYLGSKVLFSNSGHGAVTQDNFIHYSNNILINENKIAFPEQGGYFSGDNIYAKIGIVENNFFDMSQEEQLDSEIIAGGFIALKTEE